MTTTQRPIIEFGESSFGLFGSGMFGEGLFGEGAPATDEEATPSWSGIAVSRGLSADGVTEQLEPGSLTIRLTDPALSPVTFEPTRPGKPVALSVEIVDDTTGEVTREKVFTGTIARSLVQPSKDARYVAITLTAFDAVHTLANTDYATESGRNPPGGTFRQRVTPILGATGLDYEIHDDTPDVPLPGSLPTDEKKALGNLILARDTMHGFVWVDRDNVVQVYANHLRNYDDAELVLTDGSVAGDWEYIEVDPAFDSDQIINVLTIDTVDGDPEIFTDDDSVAAWGAHAQTVKVNSGDPEDHASIFFGRLPDEGIVVRTVQLTGTALYSSQDDRFDELARLDPYTPVRIVLDGVVDDESQILGVEHSITPRVNQSPLWTTTLTLRKRERLAVRWDDLDPAMTWDDVDPDMTWRTAIDMPAA